MQARFFLLSLMQVLFHPITIAIKTRQLFRIERAFSFMTTVFLFAVFFVKVSLQTLTLTEVTACLGRCQTRNKVEQLCRSTLLGDKDAQLCCVSDIGLTVVHSLAVVKLMN